MMDIFPHFLRDHGYLGVYLLMLLDAVFPIFPSELSMPLAGLLASQGEMSLAGAILCGAAGAMTGAIGWYWLARSLGLARLTALIAPRLGGSVDLDLLTRAMPVLKVRAKDMNDLAAGAQFLFASRPLTIEPKAEALLTPESRALLGQINNRIGSESDWTSEALEVSLKAMAEELGLGLGKLAQPLRAALTGQTTSPGIFDVLVLLGRDESLARIAAQAQVA